MNKENIKTLVELLERRSEQQKDENLFTFLQDEGGEVNITYSELLKKAKIVAARLQSENLKGERALLLYPAGLDYIIGYFGCLFAGVIAVPIYPPDPSRLNKTLPRIHSILVDSKASIALTTKEVLNQIEDWKKSAKDESKLTSKYLNEMNSIPWIATDEYEKFDSLAFSAEDITEDTIAYLQYTSGSTGTPRGVILTHRNLIHNSKMIQSGFDLFEKHEGVIWLPIYHDMGLIGGILQPIFSSFHATIMSPTYFLKRPLRWLQIISGISDVPVVSGGPNFAYDLCIKAASPSKVEALDLSNWKLAFSGAEPVRFETIEKFSKTFAPAGFSKSAFYPCYGLAEATLIVSGGDRYKVPATCSIDKYLLSKNKIKFINQAGNDSIKHFVSSGNKLIDSEIIIVNPENLKKCNDNEIGEVWTSSDSVAQGYWNRIEESKETFEAFTSDTNEGPFLRTGDLGFISKGELFITGRLKDLIIIDGTNHYPQDIETTVETSNKLLRPNSVAAFSIDVNNKEQLVVVQEARAKNNVNWNEVIKDIRKAISEEHNLQVYDVVLIKPKTIFKTSSGKIRRRATKHAYLTGQLDIIARLKLNGKNMVNELPEEKELLQKPDIKVDYDKLKDWVLSKIGEMLNIKREEINLNAPFTEYGINSSQAVTFVGELEEKLNDSLPATLLWEYPTLNKLFNFLDENFSDKISGLKIVHNNKSKQFSNEPVAIVGIGLRFPNASNPGEFWDLLINKKNGVSEVPVERWNVDDYYNPGIATPGKMVTKKGGFLKSIDKFDPHFFGISPREARKIDPQQRLILEVAWETLENAAISPEELMGSNTGVFIGISNNDYTVFQRGNPNELDAYSGTGSAFSIASNRVSYTLDLHGPSISLDTACSSSLVAVHLAVNSLRNFECDSALAGGVNLIITPDINISFSQAQMMSPTGSCKSFDASADGYIRSEGGGLVLLKRLSDAIKDNDNIIALIKGSAVNQDGKSNGITAPNRQAQENVIIDALNNAKVNPGEVDYIETHGTGTILGDPIEFQAIANVYGNRNADNRLLLGAVKSNIGHLESAAGIAGLIKAALSLQKKTIPPNLNFKKINPHIPIDKYPIDIVAKTRSWEKTNGKRFAAVSAFGFGGTNAHVILEEAPAEDIKENKIDRTKHVFTLSAKTQNGLNELVEKYLTLLNKNELLSLADISYTTNTGRLHFDHRLAAVASNSSGLKGILTKYKNGEKDNNLILRDEGKINGKVAFMFTGQGAQYFEMGMELYKTHPLFKSIIDKCHEILVAEFNLSLLDVLYSAKTQEDINQTANTQPALFAIEYGLAKLWESWGIRPDVLIGHSIGEIIAAVFANSLSMEDGLRLVAIRSNLMQSLPKNGEMAVIFAKPEGIEPLLQKYSGKISIAGLNGPNNTVISGEKISVAKFIELVKQNGIRTKLLTVSHAFHSHLMEPILEQFKIKISKFKYKTPQIQLISNVTGKYFNEGEIPDEEYWTNHIKSTVKFYEGMQTLVHDGAKVFVEIGPHPSLIAMAKIGFPELDALWLPSLRKNRGNWESILNSLGKLYVNGFNIDWKEFDKSYYRRKLSLPTYPFQRKRYWIDAESNYNNSKYSGTTFNYGNQKLHPLVHTKIDSPAIENHIYESIIKQDTIEWLNDHKINGHAVLPATAYLESILFAANNLFDVNKFNLSKVNFLNIFQIDNTNKILQIVLDKTNDETKTVRIFSSNVGKTKNWQLNANCILEPVFSNNGNGKNDIVGEISIDNLLNEFNEEVDINELYSKYIDSGLQYSNNFRSLKKLHISKDAALGNVQLETKDFSDYIIHPALLDSAFHTVGALFPDMSNELFLPVAIEGFNVYDKFENSVWCKTSIVSQNADIIKADLYFYNNTGKLLGVINGFTLRKINKDLLPVQEQSNIENWFYRYSWTDLPLVAGNNREKQSKLLIFSNGGKDSSKLLNILINKNYDVFSTNNKIEFEKIDSNQYNLNYNDSSQISKVFNEVFQKDDSDRTIVFISKMKSGKGTGQQTNKVFEELMTVSSTLLNIYHNIIKSTDHSGYKIILVTNNAFKINSNDFVDPSARAVWGFGNVAQLEHPEIDLTMIDLGDENDFKELVNEIAYGSIDKKIAYRNGKRLVAKLDKYELPGDLYELESESSSRKLVIAHKGILDELQIVDFNKKDPEDDEIEIDIISAGLNFRDVMNALDLYPGDAGELGGECAGYVARIGSGVTEFKVGDKVFGIAPGSFGDFAITHKNLLAHKPGNLSFDEAATIPITFLTSFYALNKLANIKKGDKVLIHAASGGVGQAAIQICKNAGAEIFATAGNDEKRKFLSDQGINYVMDSRSTLFADEILKITGGEGINAVLNSLSGEFIEKGLSILKNGGTFLEIGKVNIWSEEKVKNFRNDIKYHIIALDDLSKNKPDLINNLMNELVGLFADGKLKPLPKKVFPLHEAKEAFRFMAQTKHIGKVVINVKNESKLDNDRLVRVEINPGANYLITGGFGSLGMFTAGWLIENGAKNLILLGRHNPNKEILDAIKGFETKGVSISKVFADVSNYKEIEKSISSLVNSSGKTIKGIFHTAGVLEDSIILQQNRDKFEKVLTPKVLGALNLFKAVQKTQQVDFMVFFSSLTSLLGAGGQSNYAVANSFLDGFAEYLMDKGINAVSINWGPWKDMGMNKTAKNDQSRNYGIYSIDKTIAGKAFEQLKKGLPANIGIFNADWNSLVKKIDSTSQKVFLSKLINGNSEAKVEEQQEIVSKFIDDLKETVVEDRLEKVRKFLVDQTKSVLGLDPDYNFDASKNLSEMGLDSLMGIELKNKIDKAIGRKLPATLVFNYPTINDISQYLLYEVLDLGEKEKPSETGSPADNTAHEDMEEVINELENLSDEEAEALLLKKLDDSIDNL